MCRCYTLHSRPATIYIRNTIVAILEETGREPPRHHIITTIIRRRTSTTISVGSSPTPLPRPRPEAIWWHLTSSAGCSGTSTGRTWWSPSGMACSSLGPLPRHPRRLHRGWAPSPCPASTSRHGHESCNDPFLVHIGFTVANTWNHAKVPYSPFLSSMYCCGFDCSSMAGQKLR